MDGRSVLRLSTRTQRDPGSVSGRFALAVGFMTLVVVGTDLFVVSPLLLGISHTYGVSPGTAGSTVTVFSFAYVLGAPWFGSLADRVGRRRVLVAGLIAFSLANLLTGLAPGFGILLAARVLAGCSAAAISPSVYALVGQVAPAERRAAWMATAVAGFLIALVTGAPSGTLLGSILGWRAVFIVLAPLTLVLALVNRYMWPSGAGIVTRRPDQKGTALVLKVRAVTVTALWGFAVYALYTYLGTGLRTGAELSSGLVAVALVVYGLGAVVGSLSGGRLADRHGPGRIATLSLALLAVMQLLVDLFIHAPAGVLFLLLGLFALTAYPCLPSYQARLVTRFPSEAGSFLAWSSSAMYLGTSLGAAAGGGLLSTVGFRAIPVVGAAAGLLGALACASWAIPTSTTVATSAACVR